MVPGYTDILAYNRAYLGDLVAITIDDQAITHVQLARQVEAARRVLADHVAPGDRVAIWLPNSFAWVATFLSVKALGAISVPVNTRLTVSELDVILADCGARVLVTTGRYRGRRYLEEARGGSAIRLTIVDASDEVPPAEWPVMPAASDVATSLGPDMPGLFCIQYTSGTTSTPKGVLLTEEMYLRTAAYCAKTQVLTPHSNFMSGAPFFHCSGSMHAITVCLLAGCTLHSMSAWDVERFLHLVRQYRGNVAHGAFLRDIVAYGTAKARPFLETLKTVAATGSPKDLMTIHDELGATGVSNLYGMTETCGNITMWYPDDPLEKRTSANGRPQSGNELRIADPATGAVLSGGLGEIQMRGPTVTPGYFRRPDAAASAFTADGWFRSGDLGSLSTEGELHYVARLKEIIRVGGENVSPAEVEEAVRDASGLKHVCVVSIPHERLGEVAAAVVIPESEVTWPSVLETIKGRLANFKVPREIYVTSAFPLTGTNKIQRSVLQQQIAGGQLTRVA
jgi:acyl-CoA synthetase (AMP-forming)/AMP-acid ligase II